MVNLSCSAQMLVIIRQQTGHASEATMTRYIREGSLFRANAAGQLL